MDTSGSARWIFAALIGCARPPPGPSACDLIAVIAPGPLSAERAAAGDDATAVADLLLREARLTGDGGFRTLAEAAATCALERDPRDRVARLLRARARYHMHRFAEAEAEAGALCQDGGDVESWSLLGDAQLEQGRLEEAAASYQRAADLSPEAAVMDRILLLRWLWGDRVGAVEMAERAVAAATDAETRAWSLAWLGWLHALDGQPAPELDLALAADPSSHDARLFRAQLRLHTGDAAGAAADLDATWRDFATERLRRELDPTVDLAAACDLDPRGCALAIAEADPARAQRLIAEEWTSRQDALTAAARAWIGARAGQDTRDAATAALATGTLDPEALLLAGEVLGDAAVIRRALQSGPGLLPSQQRRAEALLARLDAPGDASAQER